MRHELNLDQRDALTRSELNVSFETLLLMPDAEFVEWAGAVRAEFARLWLAGGVYSFEEIRSDFDAISKLETGGLLARDEATGDLNCLLPNSQLGSTCRAFFPNIAKTKDNTRPTKGQSLAELLLSPETNDRFVQHIRRNLKRDGYYAFSPVLTQSWFTWECFERELMFKGPHGWEGNPDFQLGHISGSSSIARYFKWVADGSADDWDFWLEAKRKRNDDQQPHRASDQLSVSKRKLVELKEQGILPARYLRAISFIDSDPRTKKLRKFSFDEARQDQGFRIRRYYKDQKVFPAGLRALKGMVLGGTNFPASVSKYLYLRFTKHIPQRDQVVIYDPSAGFGGRLLGALGAGAARRMHYVGTDPNPDNWFASGSSRYERLARFYHRNVRQAHHTSFEFFECGSEAIRHEPKFKRHRGNVDLVFTSPPYFAAEGYSDDKKQSHVKFPVYANWVEGFLQPTLQTAVEWLKPGGYLIWNVADTKIDGKYVPLEYDSTAILDQLGMQYEEKLKLVLAHSPGANRLDAEGVPRTKNCCIVKGKYRKYEPIFVYRKPL